MSLEKMMMLLFLLTTFSLFGWYNKSKPSILILQSYDKDYAWTRDVNIGLNRILKHKELYQLRWYYMDTKRHPFPNYKDTAGNAARRMIEKTKPDVVIAVDDDAQQYVMRHFLNHPTIKIVFAGINKQASDYGFDKAQNVTGILERLQLEAVREALTSTVNLVGLKRPIQLAYLSDTSSTVMGDAEQIEKFNWAPVQLHSVTHVKTFDEWKLKIQQLGQQTDAILLTGYRFLSRSDKDISLVSAQEVVAWTEANSAIPVISGNGFYAEEGGMLAIGTSPYEQGEEAARKALQILIDGKHVNEIPVSASQQFIVTMSASKIKARNFQLPKIYEAAARTGDKYFP